jgi:GNAT superfamily N-acetyltransferase
VLPRQGDPCRHAAAAEEGISLETALWSTKLQGMLQPPKISKQDEEFFKIGVEFVEASDGIVVSELNDLFEKVGGGLLLCGAIGQRTPAPAWPPRCTRRVPPPAARRDVLHACMHARPQVSFPKRDPDKLKVALHNTHRLVWVRSTKQSRHARIGQMLGFARATSDGVLSATIWDVAVHPAWQRVGLGRAMMERLTARWGSSAPRQPRGPAEPASREGQPSRPAEPASRAGQPSRPAEPASRAGQSSLPAEPASR